ncbi:MAG TPA: uroporphyrinogen decarboxylase [Opitutaceae bacterium]|jgi:uroporphyrinogen decarboxylase
MNSRERFLKACACEPLERPPVWIMRQAGRYLPEYRELKARHGFLKLVRTPELAAEATLQPIRRFALDAAILFSDILVIPEALGQPYSFRDQGGIAMERRLDGPAAIAGLGPADAVPERLAYVGQALAAVKNQLGGTRALLGFGGSPWTLATYMVEGGSSRDFAKVKALFRDDRRSFDALMAKLTAALAHYFRMQISAGADALQIFDTWGGILDAGDYEAASLRWIREVIASVPAGFPVILYGKGTSGRLGAQAKAGARVLSVDAETDLAAARRSLPADIALQGNLEPTLLSGPPGEARLAATRLLESMRGSRGHIFNLGHGILPDARIESVEALVGAVTEWR